MNPVRTMLLATVFASAAAAQAPSATAAEVQRLQQQFQQLQQDLRDKWGKLEELPEEQREAAGDKIYAEYQTKAEAVTERLVEIVTEHVDDADGLAAIGVAINMPLSKSGRAIVVEALADHHATKADITPLLAALRYFPGGNVEAVLRKVLDENADRTAKGNACLVLAQRLEDEAEKEGLFERCVREFADVAVGDRKLGVVAAQQLEALRNIKVGKVPPDIVGKDMDGTAFKLSDYRGKAVLLDYWGYW